MVGKRKETVSIVRSGTGVRISEKVDQKKKRDEVEKILEKIKLRKTARFLVLATE